MVVLISLTVLIILHELGHFLLAKKFGVKVEEFGLFLPPRLWGKQIGETIYSINLFPLGGFVKLLGEEGVSADDSRTGLPSDGAQQRVNIDPGNFNSKPLWQRALIIAGGVISFWIIGFIIFSAVFAIGGVESVSDDQTAPNARVVINSVSSKSPAEQAGLLMGDIIKTISVKSNAKMTSTIQTVAAVQNFANAHRGEELIVTIQRGSQTLQETLTPRINPPAGEGAIGISLDRVVPVNANWWQAIRAGAQETWNLPIDYFSGLGMIIGRLIHHQALPAGAQVVGPVGIFSIMYNTAQSGAIYYLQLIAKLSVLLAVMNSLPIPALDGGKLLFLAIEAVRRKPVPASVEQPITAVFFFLLMALIILVSIGDIRRLF